MLFLSQLRQTKIEDAVEEDDCQDQCVAIILSLVHRDNETEAFHDQCKDEQARDDDR